MLVEASPEGAAAEKIAQPPADETAEKKIIVPVGIDLAVIAAAEGALDSIKGVVKSEIIEPLQHLIELAKG